MPLLFLRLMVSLTETSSEREENIEMEGQTMKKENRSWIERVCLSSFAQVLGDISMGFYLIHVQVIHFMTLAVRGFVANSYPMPSNVQECTGQTYWDDCAEMTLFPRINPECHLT